MGRAVAWRRAMPNRTLFEGGVHLVDLMLDHDGEPACAVYARRAAGLDGTRAADGDPPRACSSSPVAGSGRSRSTASARQGRATSSSAPTASTRRCAPRTAVAPYAGRASSGRQRPGDPSASTGSAEWPGSSGDVAEDDRPAIRGTPGSPATRDAVRKVVAAFEQGERPPRAAREARTRRGDRRRLSLGGNGAARCAAGAVTGAASATRV